MLQRWILPRGAAQGQLQGLVPVKGNAIGCHRRLPASHPTFATSRTSHAQAELPSAWADEETGKALPECCPQGRAEGQPSLQGAQLRARAPAAHLRGQRVAGASQPAAEPGHWPSSSPHEPSRFSAQAGPSAPCLCWCPAGPPGCLAARPEFSLPVGKTPFPFREAVRDHPGQRALVPEHQPPALLPGSGEGREGRRAKPQAANMALLDDGPLTFSGLSDTVQSPFRTKKRIIGLGCLR